MATATSQGAADQGLNVNAKNQPVVNSPDSVNLGGSKNSKFLAANSLDLTGAAITDRRNSGIQVGRSATVGDITVNNAPDNTNLYDALVSGQSQTQNLFSSLLDKVTAQTEKVGTANLDTLSALTSLPVPEKPNLKLWLGLGLAALAGFVLFKFLKKS